MSPIKKALTQQTGKEMKFQAILDVNALAAVQRNGCALRYVKDQTEAVALAAVSNDGDALQYVLDFELFKSISAKLRINIEI